MTFFKSLVPALQPIRDYLVPFLGFDAFVSLVLTILVATAILQNRRKNQSITSELENLIHGVLLFR